MIAFRDRTVSELGVELLVHQNPECIEKQINPFDHGSALHTDMWKTQGLRQALDEHRFDVALGGARRDEEKSRAKERIFSMRSARHQWDPRRQRPELWRLYNAHRAVFVGRDPGGTPRCAFLEVGARVGGSEIPFLWREVHGYDLMEAAFRIALGTDPAPCPDRFAGDLAGWLLVGAPVTPPCRVTEVTPMVGRTPGPYGESLLRPGEIIPAADAYYEHVGGRFRFRGGTSSEIEEAIQATADNFRVASVPLQDGTA